MQFHWQTTPPVYLEKLNHIYRLLWHNKNKFEQVSHKVYDKQLRLTILTLVQEINQYAGELYSLIHSLGGRLHSTQTEVTEETTTLLPSDAEHDVLQFCEVHEKAMVRAYRAILNESYLYEGIREMIRSQLNGILCSFTQLRLLQSLKMS